MIRKGQWNLKKLTFAKGPGLKFPKSFGFKLNFQKLAIFHFGDFRKMYGIFLEIINLKISSASENHLLRKK